MLRHLHLDSACLQKQVDTIREVAMTTGCMFVRGSPFERDTTTLNRVQQQLDQVYTLPDHKKVSLPVLSGRGATRGFFPIGAETGDKNNIENKESFSFGLDGIPQQFKEECPLVADNLYPQQCDGALFQRLLGHFNQTSLHIVTLLQLAFPELPLLGTMDETSFYQSFMRSFRYYPLVEQNNSPQIGNSLHTDWNLLTLVWSDQPGLEVLYQGQYLSYQDPIPGPGLVCNLGDFLSSVSQGQLRSPWHQVVVSHQIRNSLVYFGYPRASHPVVTNRVINENRLLGLFVDQSSKQKKEWMVPSHVSNMGQMYAAKWQQVANDY